MTEGSLGMEPSGWILWPLQLSPTPPRVHRGWRALPQGLWGGELEGKLRWKAQICLFICCKVKIKCFLLFDTSLVGGFGVVLAHLVQRKRDTVKKHLESERGSRKVLEGEQTNKQLHTIAHMKSCTLFQGMVPRSGRNWWLQTSGHTWGHQAVAQCSDGHLAAEQQPGQFLCCWGRWGGNYPKHSYRMNSATVGTATSTARPRSGSLSAPQELAPHIPGV